MPSCGGSQLLQRGEEPELRGQAAAQVVPAKGPARGAPEREIMGERRRTQRLASATRVLPLRAAIPSAPLGTLPRLGGGGAELRWLTGSPAW